MRKARLRALTQSVLAPQAPQVQGRNEESPIEGIDTGNTYPTVLAGVRGRNEESLIEGIDTV